MSAMIEGAVETVVLQPRAAVAAFMFDPANDAAWRTGATRVLSGAGLLQPGMRCERSLRVAGTDLTYEYEVTEVRGDERVEMRVSRPFPMTVRYELDAEGDNATIVRIRVSGDPTGFFKLAVPLLTSTVQKQVSGDLLRLKAHLQTSGQAALDADFTANL